MRLRATIEKFPLKKEKFFSLELPVLRRALRIEAVDNKPFGYILRQDGSLSGQEIVHFIMVCEGQKIDADITELDYWGSLILIEDDHTQSICHYFSTRKDMHLHGSGERNFRSGQEHGLRVA